MTINEKAEKMVERATMVTLASVTVDGFPRPVPMCILAKRGGRIYVATGTSSAKTAEFAANPRAGASLWEGGNSIVFTGKCELVTDPAIKHECWSEWLLNHFPKGENDPEYALLCFTPQHADYWFDGEFVRERVEVE